MTTLIMAMAITSLLTIIGMVSILFVLRVIVDKLEDLEICTNIYQAQLKNFYQKVGFDNYKVTNNEIIHAFDDYIKEGADNG